MNMISRRTAALAVGITAAILGTSTVAQADNSNAGHRSRATIAGIACPTVPDTSATGFSDLCTAVGVAGLGNALGAKQKRFTVFAPTNQAFNDLCVALGASPCVMGSSAADIVTALGADGTTKVTNVVKYHVIRGRHFANSIFGKNDKRWKTLYKCSDVPAHKLTAKGSPRAARTAILNTETVGQVAHVTATVKAKNGVVHVVDKVLLPGALTCA